MKSVRTWIFTLIAVGTGAASAADLGGVALGTQPDARSLERLGIVVVNEGASLRTGRYLGKTKFDSVDANTAVEIDASGNVSELRADFYALYADTMHDLATHKWGKPIDSGSAVVDGHLLRIWIWDTRDGAEITLTSFDPGVEQGSIERGSLTLISKAAADAKRGPKGGAL